MNDSHEQLKLTVRTTEDLIALAPILLGFKPEESLVMLTLSAPRQFHARVSLPTDPLISEGEDCLEEQAFYDEIVASLLGPAMQQEVSAVAFLVFTDHRCGQEVSRLAAETAIDAFGAAGIAVFEALRVTRGHWSGLMDPLDASRGAALPAHHHLETASVVSGRFTHGSRAELAATLDPDPAGQSRLEAALDAVFEAAASIDVPWPTAELDRHLRNGDRLDDAGAARLIAASVAESLDPAVWSWLQRPIAPSVVTLLSDVVRRCPVAYLWGPATILAYAAWLAGEGALAWCAVERACDSAEPSAHLAAIEIVLAQAVPPDEWPRLRCVLEAA